MFHQIEIVSAQLPDRIFIAGEWCDLFSNPLETYWALANRRRPKFCHRYNCARGYVAKWDIKGTELYLLNVEGSYFTRNFWFQKTKKPCSLSSILKDL
jgi:hypothetical protein